MIIMFLDPLSSLGPPILLVIGSRTSWKFIDARATTTVLEMDWGSTALDHSGRRVRARG